MASDERLADALAGCREDQVKSLIQEMIDAKAPVADIVAACNRGMTALGDRFQRGECFIPELMFGGMIMKSVMADLSPLLAESGPVETIGKVVLGSVQYDVHDIGKDIVAMMLRGVAFEVIDLGVDVSPEKFVAAIRQHQPAVVGMSVLLTTCFSSVTATVDAIRQAGLRNDVAIMVGGAAASELLCQNAGCDFYGKTAIDGVTFASRVVGASA
jgi:5-methyltetrahydrofolate--homocysteine methyltransferase